MRYILTTNNRRIVSHDPTEVAKILMEDNYNEELFDECLRDEYGKLTTDLYELDADMILHQFPSFYKEEYNKYVEEMIEYITDNLKALGDGETDNYYGATIVVEREREYTLTLSDDELEGITDCLRNKLNWGREGENKDYLIMLEALYRRLLVAEKGE